MSDTEGSMKVSMDTMPNLKYGISPAYNLDQFKTPLTPKHGIHHVGQGDYCGKISVEECGVGTPCTSFADCPAICNSATVCPGLQIGDDVKFDCSLKGTYCSKYNILVNDLYNLKLRYNKLIKLIPEVSLKNSNNYLGLEKIKDLEGKWQTFPEYINYV